MSRVAAQARIGDIKVINGLHLSHLGRHQLHLGIENIENVDDAVALFLFRGLKVDLAGLHRDIGRSHAQTGQFPRVIRLLDVQPYVLLQGIQIAALRPPAAPWWSVRRRVCCPRRKADKRTPRRTSAPRLSSGLV